MNTAISVCELIFTFKDKIKANYVLRILRNPELGIHAEIIDGELRIIVNNGSLRSDVIDNITQYLA